MFCPSSEELDSFEAEEYNSKPNVSNNKKEFITDSSNDTAATKKGNKFVGRDVTKKSKSTRIEHMKKRSNALEAFANANKKISRFLRTSRSKCKPRI